MRKNRLEKTEKVEQRVFFRPEVMKSFRPEVMKSFKSAAMKTLRPAVMKTLRPAARISFRPAAMNFFRAAKMLLTAFVAVTFAACLICGCGGEPVRTLTPADLQQPSETASEREKVLLLEHAPSENGYVGYYSRLLKQLLEGKNVGIRMEIFPNASLVGHTERADHMVAENELQMKVSGGPYGMLIRPLCYPSISGLDEAGLSKTLENQELMDFLDAECEKAGMRYLGSLPCQMLEVTSASAASTVDDFAGVRVRIEESSAREEFWDALGARPVYYGLKEASSALEKRLFEANVNNTLLDCVSYGLYWQDGYCILTDHEIYTYPFYVSEKFWEGLTTEQQEALQESVDEVCRRAAEEEVAMRQEAEAALKAAGIEIVVMSGEQRERMLELTHDAVYDKMCAIFGREHVEYMLSFVEGQAIKEKSAARQELTGQETDRQGLAR